MIARAATWLAGRSFRERRLLAGAAGGTLAVALLLGGLALRDDLATLRARVAAHERELAEVRGLARRLAAARAAAVPVAAAGDGSFLAELEGAAEAVVGRERIAGMTPAPGAVEEGLAEERVVLRIAGARLAECVRLLHALDGALARRVARLELRKHPDDAERFDATIEIVRLRAAS